MQQRCEEIVHAGTTTSLVRAVHWVLEVSGTLDVVASLARLLLTIHPTCLPAHRGRLSTGCRDCPFQLHTVDLGAVARAAGYRSVQWVEDELESGPQDRGLVFNNGTCRAAGQDDSILRAASSKCRSRWPPTFVQPWEGRLKGEHSRSGAVDQRRLVGHPEYVEVRSPYDNGLVGRAGIADADQVREALDATVGTAAPDPLERAAILERVAEHYCENEGPASRLISAESGLCLKDTMHEVKRAVATFRGAANEARRLAETDWEAPYLEAGEVGGPELRVVPEPVRLAVAITPFNHPLNQVVHKVAPAIAAGAPVVLKPSEKTPLSGLRLAEVFSKCGLPRNLLNVVTGCPVATLVEALVSDRRVELVSFTGSEAVGRSIARTMARNGNELVRYVPELGGNAALTVLADADLDQAVRVAMGAFGNAGQRCTAINRCLVQEQVADEFALRLAEVAAALEYGDPLNPETDVGPVIDTASAVRIQRLIEDAIREGAHLVTGGRRDGALVSPTVLDRVSPGAEIVRNETFGPVASIVRVKSVDEATEIVLADNHRLAGAIVTRDERVALDYAAAIRVG
jgi:phosphonoacetaldehyde dehydrogenase